MSQKREHMSATSAGGVVYSATESGIKVVLCGRSQTGLWALPKGTPNTPETIEETALREVREETGLHTEICKPLGHIEYSFVRDDRHTDKRVYFYLMVPVGGAFEEHDPEFDVVQWFDLDEAIQTMTYPTEATILRRAKAAIGGVSPDA